MDCSSVGVRVFIRVRRRLQYMKGSSGRPRTRHCGIAWRRLKMRVGGAVRYVSTSSSVSVNTRAARVCLTDDEELGGQVEDPQPRKAGSMVEFMRLHDNLVDTASVLLAVTVQSHVICVAV